MPAIERTEAIILEHDDGRSGSDLAQQIIEARRERIRDHSIPAGRREHLGLNASFAFGYVNLIDERVRRHRHFEVCKRGGERGRPTLVFALRKERRLW